MCKKTKKEPKVYLRAKGLLWTAYTCYICGDHMRLVKKEEGDGEEFKCSKRSCRTKVSIQRDTFFQNSNLSLQKIINFIHLWSKNYPSALIEADYSFAKQTIIDWSRFMRDICCYYYEIAQQGNQIGGLGQTMEIDETLLVKRKNNDGRLLREQWLFGGIQRSLDGRFNAFVEFADDRTEETLVEIIRRRILPGTHIMSDGWSSYRNLQDYGYSHDVVIHKENFVNPLDRTIHTHTQNIENLWGILKLFMRKKGYHRGPHDWEYIAKVLFRKSTDDVYEKIIEIIKLKYPLN